MAICNIILSKFFHYDLVYNYFANTSNLEKCIIFAKMGHRELLKVTEPEILSSFMFS